MKKPILLRKANTACANDKGLTVKKSNPKNVAKQKHLFLSSSVS
jgi:hypothetical protein